MTKLNMRNSNLDIMISYSMSIIQPKARDFGTNPQKDHNVDWIHHKTIWDREKDFGLRSWGIQDVAALEEAFWVGKDMKWIKVFWPSNSKPRID